MRSIRMQANDRSQRGRLGTLTAPRPTTRRCGCDFLEQRLLLNAHAPTAANDHYSVLPGEVTAVDQAHGLLQNDSDLDGDLLSARLVSAPHHGRIALAADGSFQYLADADF